MRLTVSDLYRGLPCLVTQLSRSFVPRNRFNHPSRFVARLGLKAIFNVVPFDPILRATRFSAEPVKPCRS